MWWVGVRDEGTGKGKVVVISMIGDAFQRYEVKFNALDSVTNKQIK